MSALEIREPIESGIADPMVFSGEVLRDAKQQVDPIVGGICKALGDFSHTRVTDLKNRVAVAMQEYVFFLSGAVKSSRKQVEDAFNGVAEAMQPTTAQVPQPARIVIGGTLEERDTNFNTLYEAARRIIKAVNNAADRKLGIAIKA